MIAAAQVNDPRPYQQTGEQRVLPQRARGLDRAFAHGLDNPPDSVLSGLKLRRHGFDGCCDTEDAIHFWLQRMQQQRLLPS